MTQLVAPNVAGIVGKLAGLEASLREELLKRASFGKHGFSHKSLSEAVGGTHKRITTFQKFVECFRKHDVSCELHEICDVPRPHDEVDRETVTNICTPAFVETLKGVHQRAADIASLRSIEHTSFGESKVLSDKNEIQKLTSDMINRAKKKIDLVCYSMALLKDSVEDEMLQFVQQKEGTLRILMLDADSHGFDEKTVLEAFGGPRGVASEMTDEMLKINSISIRERHRNDLHSSEQALRHWQARPAVSSEQIQWRFYPDMPVIKGMICDDNEAFLTSYFLAPTERGFLLPGIHIRQTSGQWTDAISLATFLILRNWFDIRWGIAKVP